MGKPQNVRVHRKDTDEVIPCELIHKGPDEEGMDRWLIAGVIIRPDLDDVLIDVLPAMTSIGIHASCRFGFLRVEGEDLDDDA